MELAHYDLSTQRALRLAVASARRMGHHLVQPEHVLLATLHLDGGRVPFAVKNGLRLRLERQLGQAPRVFGTVRVELGQALQRALGRIESSIGTAFASVTLQPLLAAVLAESDAARTFLQGVGVDEQAFVGYFSDGATPAASNEGSSAMRSSPSPGRTNSKASGGGSPRGESPSPLSQYATDLTALAESGQLDPVFGRDAEVRRVCEILGRRRKNNPILLGEAGVGKTAIAEALALYLVEGDAPTSLRGKRVYALDLASLMAGARYRGDFETRLRGLLESIAAMEGRVILFIDEIHMLMGAGNPEGGMDAANLLKPVLARGDLSCLGATTLGEYRKHIEKDPAFERRFQPVTVVEPSLRATLDLLRGLAPRYEDHHGVILSEEALAAALDLSVRYLPARRLPDKAIDILDEAASRRRLDLESHPATLQDLRRRIEGLELDKEALDPTAQANRPIRQRLEGRIQQAARDYAAVESQWEVFRGLYQSFCSKGRDLRQMQEQVALLREKGDFADVARMTHHEIPRLETERRANLEALDQITSQYPDLRIRVTREDVAQVVALWTSVPVQRLTRDEATVLLHLEERLRQRVFGQDEAVRSVARAIRRGRIGLSDGGRPIGVFLFLGPTGVGKTELARALGDELLAGPGSIVRIDMSDFAEPHAVARLVGAPPGFVGYGEAGELTEPVRRQPNTVVLLDEIEKAHPRAFDLLLQVFEDGRLVDGRGVVADFRNTLIVMTSNVAAQDRGQLTRVFRPEFVNRIDEVAVFHSLATKHLRMILDRQVELLNRRLASRHLRVSLDPALARELLTDAARQGGGGRGVRRAFERRVVDAVTARILEVPVLAVGPWLLCSDGSNGPVRWRSGTDLVRALPPAHRAS